VSAPTRAIGRGRRARVLLVAVFALALAACYPASKPVPQAPAPKQAFDAACAPTLDTMTTWWNTSPYTSTAIYLGGSSVYCRSYMQPQLNANWVSSVQATGWKLIPIWVGPQAPCTTLTDVSKLNADPSVAVHDGFQEAIWAVTRARQLGMASGPIYYDMEFYPTADATCRKVVQQFALGWGAGLHFQGYQSGFYSSLCAGIVDLSLDVQVANTIDSIWVAAWAYNDQNDPRYGTYVPNLFGYTACAPGRQVPDTMWASHQRIRQYRGGHDETWGGVKLNVDSNGDDGLHFG